MGTSRRRAIGIGLLAVAVLAGAIAVWSVVREQEAPPLEDGWTARTLVLAGDGTRGWRDGPAWRARFSEPFGVAVAADGTVYVADAGDTHGIRRISTSGEVQTVAGGARGFADGAGSAARFDTPSALAIDAGGTLYVADTGNNAIRTVTPEGVVGTLAGGEAAGYADGPGVRARFNGPVGVAVDGAGRVIVADTYNDRIRAVAADGSVSTIAGGQFGATDGPAGVAQFDTPAGVAVDAAGRILVADTANGLVRLIDPDGMVSTVLPLSEGLLRPTSVAAGPDGTIYVTDDLGRAVAMSGEGTVRTVAGGGTGFRDGIGPTARFRRPAGLAVAAPGRLVVGDAGNALVRLIEAVVIRELRLPAPPAVAPRFDDTAFARLPLLWPVWPMDGPHEVAGTLGETRGGAGAERFHAGIDVRADAGTLVHAVRDGVVESPVSAGAFGSLNEWMRVGPLTYVHVRAGRTARNQVLDGRFVPTFDDRGRLTRIRVKRGARFRTGEAIASVNPFNHVHLNVGWPGEEHNPLRFRLTGFDDTIPPTIERGGVRLFDASGEPLRARVNGRVVVSGQVRVVVDAWDQADGNRPGRRLGLYALGYQVLMPDGIPVRGFEAPLETIRFDRLTPDPAAAQLVFAPGSGIPFYGRRVTRFLYTVTNTLLDGVASESFWDTTLHPPGAYVLRAWAADFHGNHAHQDVPVRIDHGSPDEEEHVPNP